MRRYAAAALMLAACLPTFTITVDAGPPCDFMKDVSNCGKCGNVCGTNDLTMSRACESGKCAFICASPYGHCSSDDSAACETNLGTDAEHCGACGHSCGGGECVAGRCTPVLLAGDPKMSTGLKSLYGLVAFGGYVYGTNWFRDGGLVYRVRATPGQALEWLVGEGVAGSASLLATDGTTLAYVMYYDYDAKHGQGLWTVLTDGSNDQRVIAGDGTFNACSVVAKGNEIDTLAFDGTYLYITHSRDAGSPCPGIVRANADGTDVKLFQGTKLFSGLVADGGSLYFVNRTDNTVMAAVSTMLDSPSVLAKVGKPDLVRTDETYLYWTDTTAKKIYRIPKVGTGSHTDITPTSLTDSLSQNFLVDEKWLYYISPVTSGMVIPQTIYRMRKDGGEAPVAMATVTTDAIISFTQDKTALYWTTYGDDGASPLRFAAIYKVAK